MGTRIYCTEVALVSADDSDSIDFEPPLHMCVDWYAVTTERERNEVCCCPLVYS